MEEFIPSYNDLCIRYLIRRFVQCTAGCEVMI